MLTVLVGNYREGTGDYIIPRGDAVLQEKDIVFVVSKNSCVDGAAEIMTGYSAAGYTRECRACVNPHGSRFFANFREVKKHWDAE